MMTQNRLDTPIPQKRRQWQEAIPTDSGSDEPDFNGSAERATQAERVLRPDPLLQPDDAPGDVPDIGREYTFSGVSHEAWKAKNPSHNENFTEKFLL